MSALGWFALALGVVTLVMLRSLIAPMLVGAFFAGFTAPWTRRLAAKFGTRTRVAGFAAAMLTLLLILPVAILAVPIAGLITEGVQALTHGGSVSFVRQLTETGGGARPAAPTSAHDTWMRLWELSRQFAPGAASLMTRVLGTVSNAVLQILVLIASAYVFTAEGQPMLAVARRGSPLAPHDFDKLIDEAMEVARALLVGGLLTALAQAIVASVIYAALRVPNALLFAALTGVASMVPVVGTALVWIPLCLVLFGAGHVQAAVILGVCGLLVISTIDNVLRPFLGRIGAHSVHPLLLFTGVMGGLTTFGPWGLVLGPLVIALFVSAYRLHADVRTPAAK